MRQRNDSSLSNFTSREEYERWKAQQGVGTVVPPEQQAPFPPEASSRVRQVGNRIVIDPPLPCEVAKERRETVHMVLTEIDIPFWSIVSFIVKCSIAMIPVTIALGLLVFFFSAIGLGLLSGVSR